MPRKRKPGPGQCVHCLGVFDSRNWDHVFPVSWYPDTTPEDIEKWKIPSCEPCNSRYGSMEQDLLTRFGLCFGPEDWAASGIGEKAMRSLDPRHAKNPVDRVAREKLRQRIIDEIRGFDVPPDGIMPGFGPSPYLNYDSYHIVPIPKESVFAIGEKFIRGLTYVQKSAYISPPLGVRVFFAEEEDVREVSDLILRAGEVHHRGPGLVIASAFAADAPTSSLWKIQAWGKWTIYGSVAPPNPELEDAGDGA